MEQTTTLQFPFGPVGKQDTRILDHWHQLLFLCEEANRKGITHYVIRYVLGDHPPMVFGPWATREEAAKHFAALEESADVYNSFVDISDALQQALESGYSIEH